MDIHRADPQYRNRALLLLALTILLCGVLLVLLDGWLRSVNAHLLASDPDTVRHWLRWLLAGLGIGLAIPAWLLGRGLRRIGMQAREERRFPPRDWKTLRDVRILQDADALVWAGRTMVAGSIALALAAALVLWAIAAWIRFG